MMYILADADQPGSPVLGFVIILVVLGLIVLLALWGFKKSKKMKADQDAVKSAYDALPPEEKAELAAKKEKERKYFSGKYIGGHPDASDSIAKTNCQLTDDDILIYPINGTVLGSVAAKIPIKEIQNVVVEDASTVEKRVTMTRMLAVGVFAFAAKKKEVHSQYYVTISWGLGKIGNDTIFEFEGENAQTNANALRNIIAKRVNSIQAA